MKTHHILTTAAALLLAASSTCPAATFIQEVLNAGPVGYWRFEGVNDTSLVNGFTSTYQGNATVTAAGGGTILGSDPFNRALVLDGASDYVLTSLDSENTFPTAGTMLAWVNFSSLPSSEGRHFAIADKSAVGQDFGAFVLTSNELGFYTDSGSSTSYTPTSGSLLNQWHFAVFTFDEVADRRRIYWDGALVADDAWGGGRSGAANPFAIGDSVTFNGRYFEGLIDEVAIYDRALTTTEVQTIYNATLTVPEPSRALLLLLGLAGLMMHRRRS